MMQSEHDHDREKSSDQYRRRPARVGAQPAEYDCQPFTGVLSHRSQYGQRQRAHNQEGEHGDKDQIDRFGNDLIQRLFHKGLDYDHQDHRDNCRGIGHQIERNDPEEIDRFSRRHQRGPAGMTHNTCHGNRHDHVAFHSARRCVSQQDRQERKRRIREKVQNVIGLGTAVHQMEHRQKSHQRFQHTRAGERRYDRLEHAGYKIDREVDRRHFLPASCVFLPSRFGKVFFHLFKNLRHMHADDHLEHAAAFPVQPALFRSVSPNIRHWLFFGKLLFRFVSIPVIIRETGKICDRGGGNP